MPEHLLKTGGTLSCAVSLRSGEAPWSSFFLIKNRGPEWDVENHFCLNFEKQVMDDVKMLCNCCHSLNFILFGNIWKGRFLEYFRMQEIKYKSRCILFCSQRTLNFDPEVWSYLDFHFAKKHQCSFKNFLMTFSFYSEKQHKFNKVVHCSILKELLNHISPYYYNFLGMVLVFYVIIQSILVTLLLLWENIVKGNIGRWKW